MIRMITSENQELAGTTLSARDVMQLLYSRHQELLSRITAPVHVAERYQLISMSRIEARNAPMQIIETFCAGWPPRLRGHPDTDCDQRYFKAMAVKMAGSSSRPSGDRPGELVDRNQLRKVFGSTQWHSA